MFDRAGRTVAWRQRDVVFGLDGRALGLVHNRAIFSRDGRFLAHFQDGWVRDERGCALVFEAGATGGPLPPVPLPQPVAPMPEVRPATPRFEDAPPLRFRPMRWSERTWEQVVGDAEAVS